MIELSQDGQLVARTKCYPLVPGMNRSCSSGAHGGEHLSCSMSLDCESDTTLAVGGATTVHTTFWVASEVSVNRAYLLVRQ